MASDTRYAGLHDYNRAIRDVAGNDDWQSGQLQRQLNCVVEVAARYMAVARVSVWLRQGDLNSLHCVCQFDRQRGLVPSGQTLAAQTYPAYFAALAGNRALGVRDAQNDTATFELAETYLRPLQIVSLLDVPISLDGDMVGVVCHEHTGEMRDWREEDIAFAGSMGNFAAMALSQARYQHLEAEHDRLARIIEATPDIVAIMALSGYLIQINPAGKKLLGLAADVDITRFRGRDFLGAETGYLLDTEILPALHAAGRWTGEAMLNENTAQALPVSVVALAHHDAAGQLEYYSVTLHDLSAQKAIQQKMVTLNNELECRVRARTQDLESFAYSVSHDLKVPLRGIDGYSRILQTEYRTNLPQPAREYLDQITAACGRMDQMIAGLLSYSQVQSRAQNPSRNNVVDLLQHVLKEFESQITAGVELTLDVEPAVVECDREGLSQILRNFLANALKFSRDSTPPRIRIAGHGSTEGYLLSVMDNGIGFDMQYHDRIFEIFKRLPGHDGLSGSGIGLALAARAAERMSGRIWAMSAPGEGATFFFELLDGQPL